jgi:hypothetical protein
MVEYIRQGSREAPYVPRSDADVNVAEGKRRHAQRRREDRQLANRCLRLEIGRRVAVVWKLAESSRKVRLEGVLIRIYPWVDPTVIVAVVKINNGRQLKIDASRVIYAKGVK